VKPDRSHKNKGAARANLVRTGAAAAVIRASPNRAKDRLVPAPGRENLAPPARFFCFFARRLGAEWWQGARDSL